MKRSLFCAVLLAGAFSAGCQTTRAAAPAAGPPPAAAQATGAPRVFEMRTYYTFPGRLEALQRRFREHTTRIFEKHGMTNIGYWVPTDTARSKNTLIYILAYPSREAATASWAAFRNDPEWRAVATASEADGRIVERVESVFMTPTDYSRIR